MNQDFKEFFKSLNAHGVDFLIVGGVAYNFYAPPRASKGIDVWVAPSVANLQKFLDALTVFGFSL
jgi:predicted Fe-Mo cluster-binding NifX family protein